MPYIEQGDSGYWVTGSRVSLDSLVYGFLRGESAERIQESFPCVTMEQVYGAVAYYLGNRATIDAYLKAGDAALERERAAAALARPELRRRLRALRATPGPLLVGDFASTTASLPE